MRSRTILGPLALALLVALAFSSFMPMLGFIGAGPFMTARAAPAMDEVEPNSAMDLAMPVYPKAFYRGSLDVNSDPEDWFKVFVPKGMAINATVHLDDPSGLNADLEVYFYYVGQTLDRKWSITDYEYETVCILSVSDQFYYLRVFVRSGSGAYTFDLDYKAPEVLTSGQSVQNKPLYNNSYNVIDYYRVWLENRGTDADMLEAYLTKTPFTSGEQVWFTLETQHLYNWSVGIRTYDISWEDPDEEYVRAVSSETGWYYLRVNCYNGSGTYNLSVKVSTVSSDGNDRVGDAGLLYGIHPMARGSLDQAMDHRDSYSIFLAQGEKLSTRLDLEFSITDPTIFATTILQPDGLPIGEWTNYRPTGLDTLIEADIDQATQTGRYIVMVEAKVAVTQIDPNDLSESDGHGNYTLSLIPSGHNLAPEAKGTLPELKLEEDGQSDLDISGAFTDQNIPEGDRLSYHVSKVSTFSGPAISDPLIITLENGNGPKAHLAVAANWSGWGAITFTAVDLFDAGAAVSVPFTVSPQNDPPIADPKTFNFELGENVELRAIDLNKVFYDPDGPYGETLNFKVEGNGTLPAWIDSTGQLVIGPVLGLGQEEVFSVTATDDAGAQASVQVFVHVADVEHAPVALTSTARVTLNEDGTGKLFLYSIFSDVDPEDATLSFEWTGNTHTAIILNDVGFMTFTPDPDWWGTEFIMVMAKDHSTKTAALDLVVKVDPVPDAPTLGSTDPSTGSSITLDGKSTKQISVTVVDKDPEDSHRLVYIWYIDGIMEPGPADVPHLKLNGSLLKNGNHTLTLKVLDGYSLYTTASWTLTVDKPVPKPVIVRPTPQQTTTTGGVAVGIWALVLVFAAEPSRYTLLKFIWVPLYTKIGKEEVLDQFVRGRIFGFIEHNPGVTYSQIKRKVGVGNGTLTHHLSMLEKQNYVKAERDGLYKRFYPRDYQIDEDAVELNSMQKDIFFLAKTRPGISQKELADQLEVSERVVSYHIHLMQDARLLRVERTGRKHALFVCET